MRVKSSSSNCRSLFFSSLPFQLVWEAKMRSWIVKRVSRVYRLPFSRVQMRGQGVVTLQTLLFSFCTQIVLSRTEQNNTKEKDNKDL
ncbi:hypothetical protein SLA2020_170230 [Shorea laevis]